MSKPQPNPHSGAGEEQLGETAALLETERRVIAQQLGEQVIDPLNLLLAQINAYEQTLAAHPSTRMALSVLAALARQALQQARDLESDLFPTLLHALGLKAALENLASRIQRQYGVSIELLLPRQQLNLQP